VVAVHDVEDFVEQWHQKLHNNTTPDDIVICQAYLAFLKSNGDVRQFYQTLEAGKVTRDRLKSLDRPITFDPEFYPDKKDALLGEFENFLRILNSVHAGTDLESAAAAARSRLDAALNDELARLLELHRKQAAATDLMTPLTGVRAKIGAIAKKATDDAALRDLLFLDLALEEVGRGTLERQEYDRLAPAVLLQLSTCALRGVALSLNDRELEIVAAHWAKLAAPGPLDRERALHVRSVADRAARWLQSRTDQLYQCLQPKAEVLGAAFHVDAPLIAIFSEEVVRGGPTFALSLLLRRLDPLLRQAAGLGGWQLISPAQASGRVRVVSRLRDVQAEHFDGATVLVADIVSGDEEIPAGVTAVITTDTPDLVSHVAVRARNSRLLFATCFDTTIYERMKSLSDHTVQMHVSPAGDITFEEARSDTQAPTTAEQPRSLSFTPRRTDQWVLTQQHFAPGLVGGKSNNPNGLRGKLPEWIHLPTSLALPFGTFERVLEDDINRDVRRQYDVHVAEAERIGPNSLAGLRDLLQQLKPPGALESALLDAWQQAGFAPIAWEDAWHAVVRVWASKWNERAYFSRRRNGIPHDHLQMAVLIQEVVPADYAFVIHTANPLSGDAQEIYAEVVLGLGETLVGNYPGRALGFTCRKDALQPRIMSYPGKSEGLYGKGVIFRSDSNGEDLEGFAGAGLYDSFLAEEPEHRMLDYRDEKLVWDVGFRDDLLRTIARVGIKVEGLLGSAQDIEGAVAGGRYYVVQTRPQVGLSPV
jgi:alpha-glucan,water dikinase